MGLFGFKKKEEKKGLVEELPPLPPFELQKEMKQPEGLGLVSEVEHVTSRPEEIAPKPPVEVNVQAGPARAQKPKIKPKPVAKKPKLELPDFEFFEAKELKLPGFSEKTFPELPDFPEPSFTEIVAAEEIFEKPIPPVKPVFVEVDSFKGLLDDVNKMRSLLSGSKDGFGTIEGLRMEQDKQLNKWKSQLEDLQRKLIFIDRSLFEKRTV
jgi:hypothetical protein